MKLEQNWMDVVAPEFNNLNIGTIYGAPSNSVGRKIKIQTTAIKDLKPRAGYSLTFLIYDVDENKICKAKIERLSLSREQLSKFVRHEIRKIDTSVKAKIGDKDYLIKVVCSIRKSNKIYSTLIIKKINELLSEKVKDKDMKKLVEEVMDEKLQSEIKKELYKIYPIRALEIREIEPYKK